MLVCVDAESAGVDRGQKSPPPSYQGKELLLCLASGTLYPQFSLGRGAFVGLSFPMVRGAGPENHSWYSPTQAIK